MDIPVLAYMAHMHVRGKAFRFELQDPDGVRSTLLDLPKYDFNWQLRYDLQEPQVKLDLQEVLASLDLKVLASLDLKVQGLLDRRAPQVTQASLEVSVLLDRRVQR